MATDGTLPSFRWLSKRLGMFTAWRYRYEQVMFRTDVLLREYWNNPTRLYLSGIGYFLAWFSGALEAWAVLEHSRSYQRFFICAACPGLVGACYATHRFHSRECGSSRSRYSDDVFVFRFGNGQRDGLRPASPDPPDCLDRSGPGPPSQNSSRPACPALG